MHFRRAPRTSSLGWLLGLALVLLGCRPPLDAPRSVLLLSLDTTRADRLGSYGHPDAGTPQLDRLAARGTRFAHALAPAPVTLPSHATLLTGWDPPRHGVRHNGLYALAPEVDTLAEACAAAGLRTGGFVGSLVLASRHGLAQGFEAWGSPREDGSVGLFHLAERPASEVNREALSWLRSIERDPFFLFVHYMEPHAPYVPPEGSELADPYQAEIAAADRALGELLFGLASLGRSAETLVVVVADHGESLGEHGEESHGVFLYDATLRVPLLMAGPGVPGGRVVETPVGLVDVAPTLREALGLPAASQSDGRSLWPLLRDDEAPAAARPLYAETFLPFYDHGLSGLRALRSGDLKLVAAPRPELFDLGVDPGETRNLADERPEELRALQERLRRGVEEATEAGLRARAVELAPAERAALESLGYLGTPAQRDAGADPKDHIGEIAALERASRRAQRGELAPAAAELEALLDATPRLLEAWLRLAAVRALLGDWEGAIRAAQELIARAGDDAEGRRIASRSQLLIAQSRVEQDRPELAVEALQAALVVPQPVAVHENLALLLARLGRLEEALAGLEPVETRGDATPRTQQILRALRAELEASAEGRPG